MRRSPLPIPTPICEASNATALPEPAPNLGGEQRDAAPRARTLLPPCECAEERRVWRIRAKNCLSRRRVFFDSVKPEHRRLPGAKRRVADTPGSPFFGYLFWRSKKGDLPSGNPRPRNKKSKPPTKTTNLSTGSRRTKSTVSTDPTNPSPARPRSTHTSCCPTR